MHRIALYISIIIVLLFQMFNFYNEVFYECWKYPKKWKNVDYVNAKYILNNNFNVNKWNYDQKLEFTNEIGKTPIMYALEYNKDIRVINLLLENGANISSNVISGYTPFYYALNRDQSLEICKLLIKYNLDINEKCFVPPLFYSVGSMDYLEITNMLLKNGADINILNSLDENVLLFLLKEKNHLSEKYNIIVEIKKTLYHRIKYLISKGINLHHRDNKGKTALDYAIENGNPEIIKLIKDAMEKQKQAPVISNTPIEENIGDGDGYIKNTGETKINWKVRETDSIELNKTAEVKLEK